MGGFIVKQQKLFGENCDAPQPWEFARENEAESAGMLGVFRAFTTEFAPQIVRLRRCFLMDAALNDDPVDFIKNNAVLQPQRKTKSADITLSFCCLWQGNVVEYMVNLQESGAAAQEVNAT